MKLTSNEEYGLRCLLQVARHKEQGGATIPEISRCEGISEAYGAKLLRLLRRGGFVTAARGKVGGYTLAVMPEQIRISEVLTLLGGRIYEEGFCGRFAGQKADCVHSGDCSMRSLWRNVQGAIDRVLGSITLHDMLDPHATGLAERGLTALRTTTRVSIDS